MQEIKILAILSLIYVVSFSMITLINLFVRDNQITRTIHLKSRFTSQNALLYGFILSLIGTLSSLYLSEVKDLEPCKYCWFERIFLFPLVFIFFIGWIKRNSFGIVISIPFIISGMILTLYHYWIQLFPPDETCDVVSCSSPYIWELGFISIPLMAFFNFFGLLLILINYKIIGEKN